MFIVFPRFRLRISVLALPTVLIMLWLEGILPFCILFLSALLHEIGHLIALRYFGYRARRVDLLPMGALIVCPEGIADKSECVIAISGPLVSVICALFSLLWFALDSSAYSLFAALINAVLGLFNLMPIKKLDGGKALCCYLSYKNKKSAERICSVASVCSKIVFALFGIICVILSDCNIGVCVLVLSLLVQL